MASNWTTDNQIAASINETRRQATRRVNRIGGPIALLASAVCPMGIPVWCLMWLVARNVAKSCGSPVMMRGAAGEDRILTVLSGLPAEYTLFNQIRLPDEKSRTGFREADFIVVGTKGVFIIENKDYRGRIVGDESSRAWELHKVGCGGTRYVTSGRNPVRQVKIYVSLLADIFRARGIKAWITPLVSLSRDNSVDMIKTEKVQVVQGTDLCEIILAHRGTLEGVNRTNALVLEDLRVGRLEPVGGNRQRAA